MSTLCITPLSIQQPENKTWSVVPCGKCPGCAARRASTWSFRLMQQEKRCTTAHFVTLTYETCPRTKKGFRTLNFVDLQLFFKRLRKRSKHTIKYFAVGEYGSETMRPHYHIILFNSSPDDVIEAWKKDGPDGKRVPIGHTHFGSVSGASVGYTLKYISKRGQIPAHKNDDRVPERALISKGLGADYLTPAVIAWHKALLTKRVYCPLPDGKKRQWPDTIKRDYTTLRKKAFWPATSRMKRFQNRPISLTHVRRSNVINLPIGVWLLSPEAIRYNEFYKWHEDVIDFADLYC